MRSGGDRPIAVAPRKLARLDEPIAPIPFIYPLQLGQPTYSDIYLLYPTTCGTTENLSVVVEGQKVNCSNFWLSK